MIWGHSIITFALKGDGVPKVQKWMGHHQHCQRSLQKNLRKQICDLSSSLHCFNSFMGSIAKKMWGSAECTKRKRSLE